MDIFWKAQAVFRVAPQSTPLEIQLQASVKHAQTHARPVRQLTQPMSNVKAAW